MTDKGHTNKAYASELRLLRDRIALIANRVEKMMMNSIKALKERDATLARQTIDYDKTIDRDEMIIDRQCIELLARRQPLGQDLRFVVAVIKMVTYFERLGDLAVKISQRVIKLGPLENQYRIDGLEKMALAVQLMIKETLDAFLLRDYKKACAVIHKDDVLDDIFHATTKGYIKEMMSAAPDAQTYYHLLSIAKWLERMGDHCTNLAELIIFMIKGEDVRHKQIEKDTLEN